MMGKITAYANHFIAIFSLQIRSSARSVRKQGSLLVFYFCVNYFSLPEYIPVTNFASKQEAVSGKSEMIVFLFHTK